MSITIEAKDIVKAFGTFTAVNGVTFTVQSGETFGLLGPNGAGKSTLIRMLVTLMRPTSGTAFVCGHDVVGESDQVRRRIGVIPQAMTSDLELSAEENLRFYAKLYGVSKARRERSIEELLEAMGLTKWRHEQVQKLSGGMRRRVEIARGLVHEPSILFLDEPTVGLDPASRAAVWDMLHRIRSSRDLTVLVTTHYLDEADKSCDRIAIVDSGKLVALDSPARLKAAVSNPSQSAGSSATLDDVFLHYTGRDLSNGQSSGNDSGIRDLSSSRSPAQPLAPVDNGVDAPLLALDLGLRVWWQGQTLNGRRRRSRWRVISHSHSRTRWCSRGGAWHLRCR
jgi:daunorubicin resistance ABC transporter ATP-binding subunit